MIVKTSLYIGYALLFVKLGNFASISSGISVVWVLLFIIVPMAVNKFLKFFEWVLGFYSWEFDPYSLIILFSLKSSVKDRVTQIRKLVKSLRIILA